MKRREHILITQEEMHELLGLGDDVEIVQMTALPEMYSVSVHVSGPGVMTVPPRCESYNTKIEFVDWA